MSHIYNYRPPKIKKGKREWYLEYYFRVPNELRPYHGNKEFERLRWIGEINRVKTDEYAEMIRQEFEEALKNGFNPFEEELRILAEKNNASPKKHFISIKDAASAFLAEWQKRGLDKKTLARYINPLNHLIKFCYYNNLLDVHISEITEEHINTCFHDLKEKEGEGKKKWGNRTFKNNINFLSTPFNWFQKKGWTTRNPCDLVDRLKSKSYKHKFYDDKTLKKLMDVLLEKDPTISFAAKIVYYLCIRSEQELRNMRVKDIILERKQAIVHADISKTDSDRFIPLPDEFIEILQERNFFEFDPDFYVFSPINKNMFVANIQPGYLPAGGGFFSKRFAKIRKIMNLDEKHTLFSFRHTRAVHLKLDGATDVEVMDIFGHTDFATTSKYLRDIGLAAGVSEVKTRKI